MDPATPATPTTPDHTTTPAATPPPATPTVASTTPATPPPATPPPAKTYSGVSFMDPTFANQLSANLGAIMQANLQDSLQRSARQADSSAIAHTSFNAAA